MTFDDEREVLSLNLGIKSATAEDGIVNLKSANLNSQLNNYFVIFVWDYTIKLKIIQGKPGFTCSDLRQL